MKTILSLAIAAATLATAGVAEASPHHAGRTYVSGYTSCGRPVYTQTYVAYRDNWGRPVVRSRRLPVNYSIAPVRRGYDRGYDRSYHRGHADHSGYYQGRSYAPARSCRY